MTVFLFIFATLACEASYTDVLSEFEKKSRRKPELTLLIHKISEEFSRLDGYKPGEKSEVDLYAMSIRLRPLFDKVSEVYGLKLQSELLSESRGDGGIRRLLYLYLFRYKPEANDLENLAQVIKTLDRHESEDAKGNVYPQDRLKLSQESVYEQLVLFAARRFEFPYDMRHSALAPGKRGTESLKEVLTWVVGESKNIEDVTNATRALEILDDPDINRGRRSSASVSGAELRPRKTKVSIRELSSSNSYDVRGQRIWLAVGAVAMVGLGWITVWRMKGRTSGR